MDIQLNNELNNTVTNEKNDKINEFIGELQNALEDPKNKITIDKSFYDEIYNDLKLAPKYKDQLEGIIKDCMLDYSYDTEFIYTNYDERTKKYYMDIYDGDVTKVNVTKKELEEANVKVNTFYFVSNDKEYLEEQKFIKKRIKKQVDFELNCLEEKDRRKNGWY